MIHAICPKHKPNKDVLGGRTVDIPGSREASRIALNMALTQNRNDERDLREKCKHKESGCSC